MLGHRIHVYTNVSIFLIHAGIFFLKTVCLPDTHTHTHTENVCMPVLRKNIKILIYCISRINNVIPNNIINSYRQVNASHTTSDIFSIESSKSMFCQGFFSFVILFLCSSTVAFSLNSMWNNLWVVLISTETINTAKPLNPSLCCVLNGHV